MINFLEPIVKQKLIEIEILKKVLEKNPKHRIAKILRGEYVVERKANFKKSLCNEYISVIAELKRKSPSRGSISFIENPIALAQKFYEGGANAISVLTDEIFFGGTISELQDLADCINIPILRKDFIVDKIQVAESIDAGANAILTIVSILGEKTEEIISFAKNYHVDVLVEIYDETELAIALAAGAEIIAINNRNLKTFQVDTNNAFHLRKKIPDHIVSVAASGILAPALAKEYFDAGFDAVLIGEGLVKLSDPAAFIRACRDA